MRSIMKTVQLALVALGITAFAFGARAADEYVQRKPDYADATGKDWLFHHDIAAKRYEGEPAADPGVDLFYLYPTSVQTNDDHCVDGVCDIDNEDLRGEYGAVLSWKVTGAVFGDFTYVYAPHYRQTPVDTETAIGEQPEANAKMRQYWYERAPYEDVTNALTHYFTTINPAGKRPFILAGHSHGSGMLSLVMEHFFAEDSTRKAWLKNMVACYAIGWGVSKDWEAKLNDELRLYVATNATDAGVYVFWNTYGGPDPSAYESTLLYPSDAAPSVNPLLWTRAATNAPASLNLGGWVTNRFDWVLPHLYDASNNVERGTIVCTAPQLESQYIAEDPGYGRYSLHTWDYRAYWENLRANAFTRYAKFANLKPVSTNGISTVADTTWKVTVDGQEATKSPVDGTYYVAANASKVKLVYTIDAAKAAANFIFPNKKTTVSFNLNYDKKVGQWVQSQPVENILKDTQVIYNQRKPDYAKAKDWVLNHVLKPDEAKSVAGEPSQDPGVDLVYVYGTVAMTNAETTVNGFADLDDTQMRGDEANHAGGVWGMIPASVKAFSDYTRVYMPFYRQMTLCGATNVMAKVGMEYANKAFAEALHDGVAYEDLEAALDAYFAKWNQGRPFILAGCSQGAAMLRNMVERYFTQPPNKAKLDNLVACYGIAFGVTKDWADQVEMMTDEKIHFATNATERGVYISWNTVGPDSTAIPNGLVPDGAISINPLTWTTEATPADVDKNLGSLMNAATGAIIPHLYDATVDTVNGVVVSTNLPASDYIKGLVWFGDKSLHSWEISAWWENLRENGFTRYATFADLKEVSVSNIPTVADMTWKVKVKGEGGQWSDASLSPVDGKYYAPADATEVKLVYALNAAKVAEGYRFANGETTMGFAMKREGDVWVPVATKAEIEAATKIGKSTLQLGVVAQRYPWNGIVDVGYKAAYWPAGQKGRVEVTVGETVVGTNEFEVVNGVGSAAIDLGANVLKTMDKATFKIVK